MNRKLIGPFRQLLPMNELPLKGPLKNENLKVIKDGGIVIENDKIIELGDFEKLASSASKYSEIVEIVKDQVALPGLIDSHTHICYAGSRAGDYELRNSGVSYLEIAKQGGGIWDTVQKTRAASKEELKDGLISRIKRLVQSGITTVEVKSGYGLSAEAELKMLGAMSEVREISDIDLVLTCLAAHIFPKDFDGTSEHYLSEIERTLFPKLKPEFNCHRIDAFIEEEAFSVDQIRPFLSEAKQYGLDITVHADQFSPLASPLAIEVDAVSADHLEASTEDEIRKLAWSETVATVLPGASIGLGIPFAPARKLLNAGACVAIASDWNPGSGPMGDLLIQASILGAYEKLSSAEVFAGITYRAAHALRQSDRGKLESNMLADIVAFPCDDYREILYNQGMIRPSSVWKNGKRIFHNL
ncbi:MAG: imidazolonepropionase [Saprospiraceae bacterium]|jgi:imidazolonepropionase